MNQNGIDTQALFNALVTAIQTCITNYPTYNYLTQGQNYYRQILAANSQNPLLKKGQKYYSQNDEDGILLEIIKRIGLTNNDACYKFIEFGVGNGLENNSLILLMLGWKGAWVGNEELAFDLPENSSLQYSKDWISLENVKNVYESNLSKLGALDYDLLSMDLDGNDLHFIKEILNGGSRPKIIIAEYNAKFPPPIEFTVEYNPSHNFTDDYMGASIESLNKSLNNYGYTLVCCNITGSNAFFIRNDYINCFTDIPKSIDELFMPVNYGIVTRAGHPPSPKTISHFIKNKESGGIQ